MSPRPRVRRLIALTRPGTRVGARVGDEVDDELRFHIDCRVDELVAGGVAEPDARATARREFGDHARFRDDCIAIDIAQVREGNAMELLGSIWSDLRFGLRGLRRAPAFTIVAIFTLAIGIGATTAMFSVVSAVLLRALPYDTPDRIVHLGERHAAGARAGGTTSEENFADWQRQARAFEAMGIISTRSATLTGRGDPERVNVAQVSSGILDVFRVRPYLGRAIAPADFDMNAPRVALVSYAFWQARLGARRDIVGHTLTLNLAPVTVVGILPQDFAGPGSLARPIWTNFRHDTSDGRGGRSKNVFGRLRRGVTIEQAQRELTAISARLATAYPHDDKDAVGVVDPLRDTVVGNVRQPLVLLFGASALVLLIACANLSNLLLARGAARQRELAVRGALGATRGRTVRQLLTESLLLAMLGALVGFALAALATYALLAMAPQEVRDQSPSVSGAALAFTLSLTIATTLLFGLVPALRASALGAGEAVRDAGARVAGRRERTRAVLTVAQIALALTLLAASGLVLRSFARVMQVDPGIQPDHLLIVGVNLPGTRYDDAASAVFEREMRRRIGAAPGVRGVATTSLVPMGGDFDRVRISRVDGEPERNGGDQLTGDRYVVSPSWFATMGVRLVRGRLLADEDRFDAPVVCLVDELFARHAFGSADAIGRRMVIPGREQMATIVGVVTHVKTYGLDAASPGQIYMANEQFPNRWSWLVVRTAGDPLAMVPTVERAVHAIDPLQPVSDVATMDALMHTLLQARSFTMTLLITFAAVAVVMAAVGLYGVMAYGIVRRRREIGVRMAVGAGRADITTMVLREGASLAVVGVILGVVGALGAGRLLAGLLFEVDARDPAVLAGGALLLVVTALLASWIPARRAARVELTEVLRGD